MIFPQILSILSHAYTLPPLRHDLAVLQHHPYQIQSFTDPSYLAKRQIEVASVYWDRVGKIKAVFNININFVVAQMLENAGINLAQSVLTELQQYAWNSPANNLLRGSRWGAQLGTNWEVIRQQPYGVVTVGILFKAHVRFQAQRYRNILIQMILDWLYQSGYGSAAIQVSDAAHTGEVGANPRERRSITERQIFGARSDSKFCKAPIQNWPFVFTPGKLEKLLEPLITC